MAKDATKPKMQNRINVEFIVIEAVINSDSYFVAASDPMAFATAFLNSVSVSKVVFFKVLNGSKLISVGNFAIEASVKVYVAALKL